jgi:hypothetical protein
MELCSDGEDSRGSNSNNARPGVINNPLLPQPLHNWYIVVRKSNGGSCIFPSWKDYGANISSLFETSRSSITEQDGMIELAAFPTVSQAMDYLKQNPTTKSSSPSLPSPSSPSPSPLLPPLQLGMATATIAATTTIPPPFTTLPNSKRGGRLGVNNNHNFIQQSQLESRSQHHHPRAHDPRHEHHNNNTDAIPAVVTTILNAAFSNQESDGGGRGNKSHNESHSLNKNVPAANTIEIIDSDHGTPEKVSSSKTKTTVSPTTNDNAEAGKKKKRDLFGKSETTTTTSFDDGTGAKRMRKETTSKTTTMGMTMDTSTSSDKPDTTSLDALAMAAIASASSSPKRISQRRLPTSPPTVTKKGTATKPPARSPPTVIARGANSSSSSSSSIKRGRMGEDTIRAAMRRSPTNGMDNSNNSAMLQHQLRQHQYMQQQQQQRTSSLSLKIPEVPRGFVPIPDINRTVSESQSLLGMDISNNSSLSINALCGSIDSRNSYDANYHHQQQQLLQQQQHRHGNLLLQRAQQQQQRPPQPKHDYQQLYNYQQMVDLTATDDSETIDSDSTKKRRNLTNRPSRFSPSWTISDDSRLIKIVKRNCSNSKDSQSYPTDWEPIAKALGNKKSAKECEIHWVRYLMRGSRGGFWTEVEDTIIFDAVANESSFINATGDTGKKQQPFRKGFWTNLSKRLNGRDAKQTRDRWFGILNPIINHRPFTPAEDVKLWEAYNILGRKWADISESYFNLTRSERVLNNRFRHSLYMDFINSKYGPNAYQLATAAREKSNEQEQEQQTSRDTTGSPIKSTSMSSSDKKGASSSPE